MKRSLLAVCLPLLFLQACSKLDSRSRAAEEGFRKDLKAVAEIISFKSVEVVSRTGAEGKLCLVNFESEVKWLTLDETMRGIPAGSDSRFYFEKVDYLGSNLASGPPKIGHQELIKGTIVLAETDFGMLYKGLVRR